MVTDVFVIGGGPAGLAAAIAARQRGLRVTLADGAGAPVDKCCGEGLMPGGAAALRELGVAIPDSAGRFRGIRFFDAGRVAEGAFASGPGFGVRRTILQQLLVDRARRIGVDCRFNAPVADFDGIDARWIIGADGLNSRVRKWAGLGGSGVPPQRYAFRRHYEIARPPDCVEVHWRDGFQLFLTPVGGREAGVAMIAAHPRARLDHALAQLPQLRDRLGAPTTAERGAVTGNLSLRSVHRGNVALVGDASGAVDAITGEGLSLAFQQAGHLAAAMAAGDLAAYQRAHRRLSLPPRAMARVLLWLARHDAARHGAVRLLQSCPAAFRALLSAHSSRPVPA